MTAEPGPAAPEGGPSAAVLAVVRAQLAAARGVPGDAGAPEDYRRALAADPAVLYRHGGPRHLTASAVVVDRDAEHVALVWHAKGRFWVQPGGHLEAADPDLEAAARREVREETGLTDLERVGPGPAVLHRHRLDAVFGACREHWDVQYLLRTPLPAARTPLRTSAESPEVLWVPWPRTGAGPERSVEALPEGTVADMPEKLAVLAMVLADAQRADGSGD